MIPENPVKTVPTYATESLYMTPPNQEQIRNGVIPLDSLPAPWWNWLWNQLTINEGRTVSALNDILTELHNVLQSVGITPSQMDSSQLRQAVVKIGQTVGTDTTPGSVKSSDVPGKVAIASDGTMTANGLGNINDLNTDVATSIVNAINWLYKNTSDKIGALTDLQTSDKTNLVSAINSNKVANDNTNTIIGGLSSLTTAVKTSIVNAINSIVDGATKVAKAALADVASKVGHTLTINGVTFDGSADKSITINAATVQDDILKKIFKVGAYYITENSENPATTFGFGTWVELTEGRGIIQSGSSYTPGSEGGSNSVALSTANMPSHTHPFTPGGNVSSHNHTLSYTLQPHSHLVPGGMTARSTLSVGASVFRPGVVDTLTSSSGDPKYGNGILGYITPRTSINNEDSFYFGMPDTILPARGAFVYRPVQGTGFDCIRTPASMYAKGPLKVAAVWYMSTQPVDPNTIAPPGAVYRPSLADTTAPAAPTFTGVKGNTDGAGSGTAFSVLNAYRAAHIWRRTA